MAASDVKFEGVNCDACCRKDITGTRWKCEVCCNYDLCDDCYKSGKHYQDHPFLRLKKPGGLAERVQPRNKSNKLDRTTIVRGGDRFYGICCDACSQMNIPGVCWRCDVCVYYDLCLDCYMDNKHASHAFVRYDSPNARSVTVPPRQLQSDAEAGTMLHDGITCDECLEDGIFGTRWKCLLCHDYDLCDSCYMDGKHNQEHAFLKLNKPGGVATRVPPRKTTARSQLSYFIPRAVTFQGICCNSCGRDNMVGPQWNCDVCANYDLCTFCYLSNEHDLDHAFVRRDTPHSRGIRVSPRQQSAAAEKKAHCCRKHLPGVRWQCAVCSDYNLCTDCYASNKHRLDHGFLRFDSPRGTGIKVSPRQQSAQTSSAGARHTGVNCDACGEQGILGTRWKCQLCRNYDLCTVCYNGGRHEQEHAFLRILRPGDTAASVPPRKPFTKTQPKLSDEDFVDLRNPSQRKEQAPTRTEVDHAAETEQERELRQIKESLDCGICLERRRNVAFLCGHSACAVCAATLTICHMCRIPIGRKITLY
ncbi:hypothetical protein MRX96_040914 [Rhipicephalus microplus]